MIRDLADGAQVDSYEQQGVTVIKAAGRICGAGRVEVDGRVLETERIVIATGSDAMIPPIDGLEELGYWTNREATTVQEIPDTLLILGGGPVGVELAQFFARFGAHVTIVQSAERLVDREDPLGELIADYLREEGIDIRLGATAVAAHRRDGRRVLVLEDGEEVAAQELLIATGRRPRINDIGLQSLGIQPDPKGIAIDEHCRAADGVWAIGDVTGVMAFTHVGMYQGRIACADIAGHPAKANKVREAAACSALLVYGRLKPCWLRLRPWYEDRALTRKVNSPLTSPQSAAAVQSDTPPLAAPDLEAAS